MGERYKNFPDIEMVTKVLAHKQYTHRIFFFFFQLRHFKTWNQKVLINSTVFLFFFYCIENTYKDTHQLSSCRLAQHLIIEPYTLIKILLVVLIFKKI